MPLDTNAYDKLVQILDSDGKLAGNLSGTDTPQRGTLATEDREAPDERLATEVDAFFDAEESSRQYIQATTNSENDTTNRYSVKMGAKLSSDLLSQMKREYKVRHTNLTRARGAEASRRQARSSPGGPIQNSILFILKELQ